MRCLRLGLCLLCVWSLGCGEREFPRLDASLEDSSIDLSIDAAEDAVIKDMIRVEDTTVPDATVVDGMVEDAMIPDAMPVEALRTGRFVFDQSGESYIAFGAIYDAPPSELASYKPAGCTVTDVGVCTAVECPDRQVPNPFRFLGAGELRLRLNNVGRLFLDQNAEGFYFRNSDTDLLFDTGATLKVEADGAEFPAFSVEGAIAPPAPIVLLDDVVLKGQDYSAVWETVNVGSAMTARFRIAAGDGLTTTEILCEAPVATEIITVPSVLTSKMVGSRAAVSLGFQTKYEELQGDTMMQILALEQVRTEKAVR